MLSLESITCECFSISQIDSNPYYQQVHYTNSKESEKPKGAKFLFKSKSTAKVRFKAIYTVNPKNLNPADIICILQHKIQTHLFQTLKQNLHQNLFLKAFFNSSNATF